MNCILLPVFYLPPISWFTEFLNENQNVIFEKWEHFPKQTYRNRAYIFGANGKLPLIIPIHHTGKRIYKDIEISYSENWQKQHWKSIKNAYQSSPYFEFYEDKLQQMYQTKDKFLLDYNMKILETIKTILKSDKKYDFTDEYIAKPLFKDARESFSAKIDHPEQFPEYYQIYSNKYGFKKDLSVLDLLCNLGPESLIYLKKIII